MTSKAEVERWRDEELRRTAEFAGASSFAIQYEGLRPGDKRIGTMAAMLARAAEIIELDAEVCCDDPEHCPVCGPAVAWLRGWRGE